MKHLGIRLLVGAACISITACSPYATQIKKLDRDYHAGRISPTFYYAQRSQLTAQDQQWQAQLAANMNKAAEGIKQAGDQYAQQEQAHQATSSIDSVLRHHERSEHSAVKSIQQGGDPVAMITWLGDQLQRIDTRGCPPDFREAYQQHINAVDSLREQLVIVRRKAPEDDLTPVLFAIGKAFGGNIAGAFGELSDANIRSQALQDAVDQSLRAVGDTWREAKVIAVRNGAIP